MIALRNDLHAQHRLTRELLQLLRDHRDVAAVDVELLKVIRGLQTVLTEFITEFGVEK